MLDNDYDLPVHYMNCPCVSPYKFDGQFSVDGQILIKMAREAILRRDWTTVELLTQELENINEITGVLQSLCL